MSIASVAENVTLHQVTVEEGFSTQFQCDSNATSPFYYYKYYSKNINPQIVIADTLEEYP